MSADFGVVDVVVETRVPEIKIRNRNRDVVVLARAGRDAAITISYDEDQPRILYDGPLCPPA